MKITRVNDHWFIGRIRGAAFFGQSVGEVNQKANEWHKISTVESAPREVERKAPKLRLVQNG